MNTSRREFLATSAAALTAPLTAAGKRPPNIVFIVLDDAGYGDLGCYGQKLIRTPNIDRFATEGTRFTDFYAGGAVCAPSRCALMTGLHTGHGAIRANAGTVPLHPEDYTVAQALKKAGYTTGGFGKWGLADAGTTGVPSKKGFDHFFGYLHQVHAHSYFPDFLWDDEKKYPLSGNKDEKGTQYSADIIAERGFQFLRENKDGPFFLYFPTTLPHAKFEIPSVAPYEKEPWEKGQKTYAAMMTRADSYVGRILGMLREYKLEDNTVVFVTSDNGAHSGEGKGFEFFRSNGPLRGEKGQMYEGGIRVPMIVRWPGKIKAGATNDTPWAFWDFFPTAAAIAGTDAPGNIDGVSCLPLLTGGTKPKREFLYWEFDYFDRQTGKENHARLAQGVRMGDWKAVRLKTGAPLELYNLRTDIGETKDVAAQNPRIVARIEDYLKTARTTPRLHNEGDMDWVK